MQALVSIETIEKNCACVKKTYALNKEYICSHTTFQPLLIIFVHAKKCALKVFK
jgi:hypothetical protein